MQGGHEFHSGVFLLVGLAGENDEIEEHMRVWEHRQLAWAIIDPCLFSVFDKLQIKRFLGEMMAAGAYVGSHAKTPFFVRAQDQLLCDAIANKQLVSCTEGPSGPH